MKFETNAARYVTESYFNWMPVASKVWNPRIKVTTPKSSNKSMKIEEQIKNTNCGAQANETHRKPQNLLNSKFYDLKLFAFWPIFVFGPHSFHVFTNTQCHIFEKQLIFSVILNVNSKRPKYFHFLSYISLSLASRTFFILKESKCFKINWKFRISTTFDIFFNSVRMH